MSVDEALESLESGDLSVALLHLLRVWDKSRDPLVGAGIERLGVLIETQVAPFDDWLTTAKQDHPADARRLTDALFAGDPGKDRLKERVQLLLQRPPDPRVFRECMDTIRNVPWSGWGVHYQKLLTRHLDPHPTAEPLQGQLAPHRQGSQADWNKRLARVRKQQEAAVTTSVPEGARLEAAIERAASTPSERWTWLPEPTTDDVEVELWKSVLDDPDADTPRRILADWIGETNPDWATFIQLQLDDPEHRAMKALNKRTLEFLGPLAGHVDKKGHRFERGFLDAATVISADRNTAQELGDLPEWAIATALWCRHTEFFSGSGVADLHSAGTSYYRCRRANRWLPQPGGTPLAGAQIRKLAKLGPWPWRVLQISTNWADMDLLPVNLPKLQVPRLQTLVIPTYTEADVLELLPPVAELVLNPRGADVVGLIAGMPTLERFTLAGMLYAERGDAGWEITLVEPTSAEKRRLKAATHSREELVERLKAQLPVVELLT